MKAEITYLLDDDTDPAAGNAVVGDLMRLIPHDHLDPVLMAALEDGTVPRDKSVLSDDVLLRLGWIKSVRIIGSDRQITARQFEDASHLIRELLDQFHRSIVALRSEAKSAVEHRMVDAIADNHTHCAATHRRWHRAVVTEMASARERLEG